MKVCGPQGRDCIERNSFSSFNCSVRCEGIYADVQWVDEPLEEEELEKDVLHWEQGDVDSVLEGEDDRDLVDIRLLKTTLRSIDKNMMLMYDAIERKTNLIFENKIKLSKNNNDKKGEELDKEKFKRLISEYRKFKMKNVKHFRFNENATSNMFGKF